MQYEYDVIEASWIATNRPELIREKLNMLGNQGWRVSHFIYDNLILERELPRERQAKNNSK